MFLPKLMKETKNILKTPKLSGLLIFEKDDVIYATTRVNQENWNPAHLIVLSPRHPVTRLILRGLHEVDHRGVVHTVARSRSIYCISQAAKIVRKIKPICFNAD